MFETRLRLYSCLVAMVFALVAFGNDQRIVILQSSDVHGRIKTKSGAGWLKIGAAIKAERKAHGNACLWIDCGDAIQGTLSAALTQGQDSVDALKALKADIWILGNHELDFGVKRLKAIVDAKPVPILNGNLLLGGKRLDDYKILDVGGYRVAVLGMNSSRLDTWFVGPDYKGMTVESAVDRLEKVLPKVAKHNPHLVVLGIHDGLLPGQKGNGVVGEVARRFPQIQLIMGAHTHQEVPGKRLWGAHVVQPGAHGDKLSKIEVTFDAAGKVADIRSRFIDVTAYEPDPKLTKVMKPHLDHERAVGWKTLARLEQPVTTTGTPGVNNQFSEIMCRAVASATGADVVLHGTHNDYGLNGPRVTNRDLFYAVPYENAVFVMSMTRQSLAKVIGEQVSTPVDGGMQGVYGVTVRLAADKSITSLELPAGKQTVTVAVSSFCAAGGGGRFPILRSVVDGATLTVAKKTTRQMLADYVSSDAGWSAAPRRWLHFADEPGGKTRERP